MNENAGNMKGKSLKDRGIEQVMGCGILLRKTVKERPCQYGQLGGYGKGRWNDVENRKRA